METFEGFFLRSDFNNKEFVKINPCQMLFFNFGAQYGEKICLHITAYK